MFNESIKQLRPALMLLACLTLLTGLFYPLAITSLAQLFFPWQANGSIIQHQGKSVGSLFIGQSFTAANYFWGRPSATTPFPYNGQASTGSNSGPSNEAFLATVKERVFNLQQADPQVKQLIPVDLVTASGSGLDPEISPAAAFYQIPRIARACQIPQNKLKLLIQHHIQTRSLKLLGEPRVNVLQLNLALDNLRITNGQATPRS